MMVRYIAIYKLHGARSLPEGVEASSLLVLQSPMLTATLAANPEPYFLHIDKSTALATQLLKGLLTAENEKGTLQERLSAEISVIKDRRIKSGDDVGVFLVFEGGTEVPSAEFEARRDTDEFAVCFDAIPKAETSGELSPIRPRCDYGSRSKPPTKC